VSASEDLEAAVSADVRRLEGEIAELKAMLETLRVAKAAAAAIAATLPPPAAANDNGYPRARPSGWWPRTILECRSFTRSDDPRAESENEAPTRKIGVAR
jgi:hypothetical protein